MAMVQHLRFLPPVGMTDLSIGFTKVSASSNLLNTRMRGRGRNSDRTLQVVSKSTVLSAKVKRDSV